MNNNISHFIDIRIGLYRNNKLVKVFPSQANCAKYYKLNDSTIHHNLIKNHFNFLKANEVLKKISDTTSIKFESNLFKKHIAYLKKQDKLNFYCDKCLVSFHQTLPIYTFQTFGCCQNCFELDDVSCGSINKWLINNNYNLKLSDRSVFLKKLIPFNLVDKLKPVIIDKVESLKVISKEEDKIINPVIIDKIESLKVISKEEDKIINPVIIDKVKSLKVISKEKHQNTKHSLFNKLFKGSFFDYFLSTVIVVGFFTMIRFIEIGNFNFTPITHNVKAIILDKDSDSEIIIYKNIEGNIFKINKALRFWGCGEKGDSILVHFKNPDDPYFIKVEPLNK